jgi:hypothetical protein
MTQPAPGWYPDHQDAHLERWWGGTAWTESIGASPGAGLWVALLGSGVLVGGVVKQWRDGRA